MTVQKKVISLSSILLFLFGYQSLTLNNFLIGKFSAFLDFHFLQALLLTFMFLFILAYIAIDFCAHRFGRDLYFSKLIILIFATLFLLGLSLYLLIDLRLKSNQVNLVHDGGVIQTEIAVQMLLAGRNFYSADYTNTLLEFSSWGEVDVLVGKIKNPALYHYIYLPFYVILSVPFYLLSHAILGVYDQRMLFLLFYLASLFLLARVVRGKENKLLALVLFGLNPWIVFYVVDGRNDIFVLTLFLLTVYLIQRKNFSLASVALILACLIKQSAWFLASFYVLYLFYQKEGLRSGLKFVGKNIWLAGLTAVGILGPFLAWDFPSFWQDVYLYPAGSLPTSYPVNGFGLSALAYTLGAVGPMGERYPHVFLMMAISLPLLVLLLILQKKNNTLSYIFTAYGIFLAVFWFFSRFYNENYIVFVVAIFTVAYLLHSNEKDPISSLAD